MKNEKYQSFLSENFQFLEVKFSIYLNRLVFVMTSSENIQISYLTSSDSRHICLFDMSVI